MIPQFTNDQIRKLWDKHRTGTGMDIEGFAEALNCEIKKQLNADKHTAYLAFVGAEYYIKRIDSACCGMVNGQVYPARGDTYVSVLLPDGTWTDPHWNHKQYFERVEHP